jgi:hypothetical protein
MDATQFPTLPGVSFVRGNNRGVALTTSLVLLAVLTLLGTGAMVVSLTDIQIGTNYKTSTQALYDAEAGVHYALANIQRGVSNRTLSLRDPTVTVNYVAPSGFAFAPITTLTRVGTTSDYRFRSTGRASNASSTIEVVFRSGSGWSPPYGIFGDKQVELGRSSTFLDYDSRITPSPTPPSTIPFPRGQMDVGSNENLRVDETVNIAGRMDLGKNSSGTPGIYTPIPDPPNHAPCTSVAGGCPLGFVDRVCPDPLDANGDGVCVAAGITTTVAASITTASTNNNNANASPPISGNVINASSGQSITLPAGTYYLSSITLNSGSTLNFDTSAGEVQIYLTGPLNAKSGSTINYPSPTAKPTDFTLYSNATAPITLAHNGEFKGTIYAPFAKVDVNNRTGVFQTPLVSGLLWAKEVAMTTIGSQFYFDIALKDKFRSNNISVVSWKEVRN